MKFVAIICEFNPLHNGHELLIKRARELSEADAVLCIMSPDFTQRAEPAIASARVRAQAALLCGADVVLELPTLYATACGERFSEGAVNIINSIKGITHLAFGSESGDIEFLSRIADIRANESNEFKTIIKGYLSGGISYAKALSLAISDMLKLDNDVSLPNDLLGVEYLIQLRKFGLCDSYRDYDAGRNVEPITIKRVGANHHDNNINGEFSSSSAIREAIATRNIKSAKDAIPKKAQKAIMGAIKNFKVDYNKFELLAINALRLNDLSACPDNGEGLDNKLKAAAQEFVNLDNVFSKAKSKRYTHARLRRLTLQAMLGITHYPDISGNGIDCDFKIPSRLIGISKKLKAKILPCLPVNIIKQNRDYSRYVSGLSEQNKIACNYIEKINANAALIYLLLQNRIGGFYKDEVLLEV